MGPDIWVYDRHRLNPDLCSLALAQLRYLQKVPDMADTEKLTPRIPEKAMAEMRLYKGEVYWRGRYNWLKKCGYLLRPRYHPEWVARGKEQGSFGFCAKMGKLKW